MDLDDPVCLCFGVSKRKLLSFLRVRKPGVASRLSECGGAGTGCGWCVPYLKRLFDDAEAAPGWAEYARGRAEYLAGRANPCESAADRPAE